MAKIKTSISIEENLWTEASQFGDKQRPGWSFSTVVKIALEDFLSAQAIAQQEAESNPIYQMQKNNGIPLPDTEGL